MAIPQSFIQELLARADVVDVVGRHVQLKKGGANFMGLCPFHGEKSPSFSVSPAKQFFHCFGCGKNGNAIGFLMEHTGSNFVETVNDLAQQYGMQVPEDDRSPQDRERAAAQREKQQTLTDVLEKAGEAWRKQLKASPHAIDYLKGRGLSGEIAKQFGLGYAPEGWRGLASVFPNYDDPLLVESGLVKTRADDQGGDEKRYDCFRDRIMFPIRNVKGECIGFGGRVLGDGTPKYLNSPETPVFSKGRELYGLFEARTALREKGFALVTEGYMDVVALAQWGFANAVATLGTACTPDHVQKLFRFTDKVVFSFDGDGAGRRAARKALDIALPFAIDERTVQFLFLPPEHDPDSFVREFGTEAFDKYISNAVPLSRFLIDAASEGCDLATIEGRSHMASNAKPLWSLLPDGAIRLQLLAEIADLAQLGTHELSDLWGLGQRPRVQQPGPPSYGKSSNKSSYDAGPGTFSFKNQASQGNFRRSAGRSPPPRREDRALQLLFTEAGAWDALSNEEHALLCALPAPHGPLFGWLDSQNQEHGPQPWAALREGLRGEAHEDFLVRQISDTLPKIENDAEELRYVLRELAIAQLETERNTLAAQAATDPAAYARYRALDAQYRLLKAAPKV
ncbi:MAG: DNA primase [Pseudomonadota bacterium]